MSPATRKPAKKPAKKGAKKPAPARRSPAKAQSKAPVRAKPAAKGRSKAAAPRKAARPARKSHVAEVRALVARPRPGQHPEESQVEHDHHDPRLAGIDHIGAEGDKVQAGNYGQTKNRAVARLDKPTNWFRRAAKPKQ